MSTDWWTGGRDMVYHCDGILSGTKRSKWLTPATPWTNLRNIVQRERATHQRARAVFTRNSQKRHVGKDRNWLCDCSKLGLGTGVGFGWAGGIDRFRGDGTIHAQTDAWCWSLHLVKLLTITELYTWQGRTLYCVKNSSSAAWIKSHTSWSPEDNGVLLDRPTLEPLQWTEWRETLSSRCWRALLYPWQLYFEGPPVYFRGNQSVESY